MEVKLIRRVIDEGDHLAFTALVRMHQSAIRNFLRRLTNGDHALADDLSQETFLKAFSHIKSFSFKGKFISWLFQIAYRQFISEMRRNKKRINDVPLTEQNIHIAVCESDHVLNSILLNQCLAKLSATDRSLLTLNYQLGMTHQEVSDIMEMPLGTVKTTIRRAKQKLSAMMEDNNSLIKVKEVGNNV
jgi:RNA polymerase sigma-70 factor (ECF subfamily)